MKLIDADIYFFEELIKQYEEILKLESKNLFDKDMKMQELVIYFNKKYETVEKAIWKMIKVHSNYRYVVNNEYVITKEGIEWLCKNFTMIDTGGIEPDSNDIINRRIY